MNEFHIPRWRGFNLLEKFTDSRNAPFRESDFEWMAEWGFDFARLPLSYRCWADVNDWLNLDEDAIEEIDQAVEFGRKHKVHVNINFHRAPGYCVNPPKEPLDLWSNDEALEACAFHWAYFAKRYKGIPNTQVSFDLLNEPAAIPEETYVRVVKRLVEAIRAEAPNRFIVADGLRWGREPVHGLADLGIAQSGEWGAFQHTPHKVVLAWMRDCLELWKEAGWGWAMWNFRGSFGILDSNRADVKYEEFHGHKLDREMLELVRAY